MPDRLESNQVCLGMKANSVPALFNMELRGSSFYLCHDYEMKRHEVITDRLGK